MPQNAVTTDELAQALFDAISAQFTDPPGVACYDMSSSDDLSDVTVSEGFSLRAVAERLLSSFDISSVPSECLPGRG